MDGFLGTLAKLEGGGQRLVMALLVNEKTGNFHLAVPVPLRALMADDDFRERLAASVAQAFQELVERPLDDHKIVRGDDGP